MILITIYDKVCLKSNVTFALYQNLIADMGLSSAELDVSVSLPAMLLPSHTIKGALSCKKISANGKCWF